VIDSYKSLLPDSASNTVVLLAQISRQLDGLSNGTHVTIDASSLSLPRSNPQPPTSAVLVNVFWFLSLVIALFCALLATLQQRWARRYLRLSQPQIAIHKRARIRSFFAEGVARFHAPIVVEAIPALLHVSVFLFLAGLVISLFNIHHTLAYVVLTATSVCVVVYAIITMMPAIYHDSPYTTPLSAPAWYFSRKMTAALLYVLDRVVTFLCGYSNVAKGCATPLRNKVVEYRKCLSRDMTGAANDAALKLDGNIDARALGWTLDRLDEEGELLQFAAGIPGFSRSTEVKDPVTILKNTPKHSDLHPNHGLYRHIALLLIRAAKPGLLPDSKQLSRAVRQQRISICLEALYFFPSAIEKILGRMAHHEKESAKKVVAAFSPIFQSFESWHVADRLSVRCRGIHPDVTIGAQCVAAVIATRIPASDQTQQMLVKQLKIKDRDTLFDSLQPFDSLLLKNLNNFLENTALKCLELDNIDIIIFTIHLIKGLALDRAKPELCDQFSELQDRIDSHAKRRLEPSDTDKAKNAKNNAERLLKELEDLTPNGTGATASLAPVHSPGPQASMLQRSRQLSDVADDTSISFPYPSSPSTSYNNAYPLTSMV
jgi:hypothetical protein